jgi:transcriptional regulator with XRE-family HTH domain
MQLRLEISGLGTRPYPLDKERRRRVLVALAEKDMSISALARALGLSKVYISYIVNGLRLSAKTERRIAEFLGRDIESLFPPRTAEEIGRMRRAEARAEKAAKGRGA